jgi:hypothetical protein
MLNKFIVSRSCRRDHCIAASKQRPFGQCGSGFEGSAPWQKIEADSVRIRGYFAAVPLVER